MPSLLKDPRYIQAASSVNDTLANAAIRHSVYLEHFKTGEVRKIITLLNRDVFPDIIENYGRRLSNIATRGFDTGPATTQRIANLVKSTRAQIGAGVQLAGGTLVKDMKDFALTEAEWQRAILSKSVPLDLQFTLPSVQQLRSIVTARPMQGAYIKQWFDSLSKSSQLNFVQQLNIGLVQGESVQQLTRRLASKGGVLDQTRRHIQTHVRTAVNHVSTHAREATYEANDDVIKAVQIVATLDARTTDICMAQDGKTYPINEGWRPPGHHQCRTTTVPITKSWKELGIKGLDAPPAGTRASMNGQVPARQTYGAWLKKQPRKVQNSILGKERAELFRQGKVPITKFVDHRGKSYTLEQLRRKEGLRTVHEQAPIPTDPLILQEEINDLLAQLQVATDPKVKKRLRAALRKRGHRGGLKKTTVKKKTKKKVTPKPPITSDKPDIPRRGQPDLPKLPEQALTGKQVETEARKLIARRNGLSEAQLKKTRASIRQLEKQRDSIAKQIESRYLKGELGDLNAQISSVRAGRISGQLAERVTQDYRRVNRGMQAEIRSRTSHINDQIQSLKDSMRVNMKGVKEEIHALLRVPLSERSLVKAFFERSITSLHVQEDIKESSRWLSNVLSKRSVKHVGVNAGQLITGGRPYHSVGTIYIAPDNGLKTILHEIGHLLEFHNPKWKRAANAFLSKRTAGERAQSLRKLTGLSYRADEVAKPDKFIQAYMGKIYKSPSTEISSMALEMLYADPVKLLQKDPEMFRWIVDMLHGVEI